MGPTPQMPRLLLFSLGCPTFGRRRSTGFNLCILRTWAFSALYAFSGVLQEGSSFTYLSTAQSCAQTSHSPPAHASEAGKTARNTSSSTASIFHSSAKTEAPAAYAQGRIAASAASRCAFAYSPLFGTSYGQVPTASGGLLLRPLSLLPEPRSLLPFALIAPYNPEFAVNVLLFTQALVAGVSRYRPQGLEAPGSPPGPLNVAS